jgi:hypothetical protein
MLGTDAAAIARLGASLAAAGYDSTGFKRALGQEGYVPKAGERPAALAELDPADPLGVLIPLFLLELPVARADAERVVDVADAVTLGLIEDGAEVRPLVRLVPSGHAVFASDREHGGGQEHVLGVTPSSALLGNLATRQPVRRALDLGTGCGIQAYLLAKHAEQIVATDINERALDFARFNLALNGAAGVELRRGNWLEPVAGERFDLVVCNPPFVISPESHYTYRDSGLPADELVRRLVADLPSLLEDGGTAQLLLSWIVRAGESWPDPVARWLDGNSCDALLLRYRLDGPRGYAEHWNRGEAAAVESWVEWYEELGAEALAYGALAIRRRAGAGGFVTAEVASDRLEPGGDHIHRILDAQALLAGATDDELLDRGFALTHDHVLDQQLVVRDGEWEVETAVLRLQEGLGFEAGIDAFTAALLARLDAGITLRAALEEAVAAVGRPRAELHAAALPLVRGMLELGFLRFR